MFLHVSGGRYGMIGRDDFRSDKCRVVLWVEMLYDPMFYDYLKEDKLKKMKVKPNFVVVIIFYIAVRLFLQRCPIQHGVAVTKWP